jgi:hypothetical protein
MAVVIEIFYGSRSAFEAKPKIIFQLVCPLSSAKPLSPVKTVDKPLPQRRNTMKSHVRTFFLPAVAAVSKRPKAAHLLLLLGLVAPMPGFASSGPYCISVDGGFGGGGTTFVGPSFALPRRCKPRS